MANPGAHAAAPARTIKAGDWQQALGAHDYRVNASDPDTATDPSTAMPWPPPRATGQIAAQHRENG